MKTLLFTLPLLAITGCPNPGPPTDGAAMTDGGTCMVTGTALPAVAGAGMAFVNSDHQTTSISLFDPQTKALSQADCIDSASVTPGQSSLALSGDVVLPSQPQPSNELTLIDRTNAAILWVDPVSCKPLRQLSVGTGFSSNPQDLIDVSTTKAYVPRFQSNPTPSGVPGANDQGDDLLIINPSTPSVTGRIDLSSYATTVPGVTLQARPGRALNLNGKVYLTLESISADFKTYGAGRVVIIDPATDAVTGMIDLPTQKDCTALDYIPSSQTLLVACGGDYNTDLPTQVSQSGISLINLGVAPPTLLRTLSATRTGNRPIAAYAGFAVVTEQSAFVATYGDASGAPPDALYALDLNTGDACKIADADGSYVLGGILADHANNRVYVTDSGVKNPRVNVYDVAVPGAIDNGTSFISDPKNNLPPQLLGWY